MIKKLSRARALSMASAIYSRDHGARPAMIEDPAPNVPPVPDIVLDKCVKERLVEADARRERREARRIKK